MWAYVCAMKKHSKIIIEKFSRYKNSRARKVEKSAVEWKSFLKDQ